MATIPLAKRFWAKIDRNGPLSAHRPDLGPCWIWTGTIDTEGYGRLYVQGRQARAHRLACELLIGPIPKGLEPDHLCRVRACVKAIADEGGPAHLEPVTHAENMRRGVKGELTTHCPAGHPYDEANTYRGSRGNRDCRACNRQAVKRYKERKKLP